MSTLSLAIFAMFLLLWFYSIFSSFFDEFKDKKQKIFWRIGLIFVPFLAFFYIFMRKNLLR